MGLMHSGRGAVLSAPSLIWLRSLVAVIGQLFT